MSIYERRRLERAHICSQLFVLLFRILLLLDISITPPNIEELVHARLMFLFEQRVARRRFRGTFTVGIEEHSHSPQ